jgi:hypothetical protein
MCLWKEARRAPWNVNMLQKESEEGVKEILNGTIRYVTIYICMCVCACMS